MTLHISTYFRISTVFGNISRYRSVKQLYLSSARKSYCIFFLLWDIAGVNYKWYRKPKANLESNYFRFPGGRPNPIAFRSKNDYSEFTNHTKNMLNILQNSPGQRLGLSEYRDSILQYAESSKEASSVKVCIYYIYLAIYCRFTCVDLFSCQTSYLFILWFLWCLILDQVGHWTDEDKVRRPSKCTQLSNNISKNFVSTLFLRREIAGDRLVSFLESHSNVFLIYANIKILFLQHKKSLHFSSTIALLLSCLNTPSPTTNCKFSAYTVHLFFNTRMS